MKQITEPVVKAMTLYAPVTAFALIAGLMGLSYALAARFSNNRIHGSAIAVLLGLVLAGLAGYATGGNKGVADISCLAGVGLLGGAAFRDLAIVATAFGVDLRELLRMGLSGVVALILGVCLSFAVGAVVAFLFGYRDAVSMTTLGAGAATYIVGPVTGTALGASSEVIALSVAAGLIKSVSVMILTPIAAKSIGLDSPRIAMIFGGLVGTTSGVAAGLAATNERLVPYGAMTATFYTGLGCLLGPSLCFLVIRTLVA